MKRYFVEIKSLGEIKVEFNFDYKGKGEPNIEDLSLEILILPNLEKPKKNKPLPKIWQKFMDVV